MNRNVNPLELSDSLLENYRRYLGTTFPLVGSLREKFLRELANPEALLKGPILEATPPFLPGRSIRQLMADGQASREFASLHHAQHMDLDRPLYLHQDRAFARVVGGPDGPSRNAVVATGTGSGKTESFLYPILDDLLREREAGTLTREPGVRALLLYPMNALAHDQLKRLRQILAQAPDITFGRYTGDTPETKKEGEREFSALFPGEPRLKNELVSREEMKENPPHILLTNYAMLEYLLLRPEDNTFFDGEKAKRWKFWVLDELHTYSGAVACDVALLLRRLKDRVVGSEPGRLRCIGTSATLGDGAKDNPVVAAFASQLFGEEFQAEDLILAERERLAETMAGWGVGTADLYAALREAVESAEGPSGLAALALAHGVPEQTVEAAKAAAAVSAPLPEPEPDAADEDEDDGWMSVAVPSRPPAASMADAQAVQRFLYALLAGDDQVHRLRLALQAGPARLRRLAGELFASAEDPPAVLVDLVALAAIARERADKLPLLPARYHLFVRALEGAFVAFHPETRELALSLDRKEHMDLGGQSVRAFELSACRRCGHPYLAGRLVEEATPAGMVPRLTQFPEAFVPDEAANTEEVYFRWDDPTLAEDDEDEEAAHKLDTKHAIVQLPHVLCLCCGAVRPGQPEGAGPCGCGADRLMPLQLVRTPSSGKKGQVSRCPACHHQPKHGRAVDRLTLGQDAPVAVLATVLYQSLPPSPHEAHQDLPGTGRKLIVFSDSRQDAAFFAPYLQNTYDAFLDRRRLMLPFERGEAEGGTRLHALARTLATEAFLDLFPVTLHSDHQARLQAAWRWIMQEFRTTQSRLSLEGVGLVRFRPATEELRVLPDGALRELQAYFGRPDFSREEANDLIQVLVGSVRARGAIDFPAGLTPQEEAFAPIKHHVYCRDEGADAKLGILGWLPTGKRQNSRVDYLMRVARRERPDEKVEVLREGAIKLLRGIWRFCLPNATDGKGLFVEQTLSRSGAGTVYQLDHRKWVIEPMVDAEGGLVRSLWRCPACLMMCATQVGGVCPTFRCQGTLEALEALPLDEHHYRHLYRTLKPVPLRAEEHTAQLETKAASRCQQEFIQGKINVLSCSTTFELGVDVGELQTVLMRNVPPETANYLQRAGRAGRRADSVALVVTYAQRRSHDLYHFREPEKMVGGKMRPPSVEIRNLKLVIRHVYAMAFALLFRRHHQAQGGLLPKVSHFFEKGDGAHTGPELMAMFLASRPAELLAAVRRVVPAELHEELGVESWGWLDELLDEEQGLLPEVQALVEADLSLYDQLERDASAEGNHARAGFYQRLSRTVRDRPLLNYLGANRLLPKYGFPVHTVELTLLAMVPEAERLQFSRDLRLAIGEYAPGSQVVGAGKVWVSAGLKRIARKEWPQEQYVSCRCGWFQVLGREEAAPTACMHCGEPIKRAHTLLHPEFGFVTGTEAPEPVGESRPMRGYASQVFFTETLSRQELEAMVFEPIGAPDAAAGVGLSVAAPRLGQMVVVNRGPKQAGFNVCGKCGAASPALTGLKKEELHTSPLGKPCDGFVQVGRHLGHSFATDVLELRFDTPTAMPDGFWRSLTYALLEAASRALQIRRDDLDGCLFFRGHETSIILFDNVPGGAGHARLIQRQLRQVLLAALEVVNDCACDVDTSCYECLRTYRNQAYHRVLRRGPVKQYLEWVRAACLEPSGDGAYAIVSPSRGRWLQREVRKAQEAWLVVPRLTLFAEGEVPFGAPNWVDTLHALLESGRTVHLAVREDGLPSEKDANGAFLRHELKGLIMRGLRLYSYGASASPPEWPIVIAGGDDRRVARWASEADAEEEGLSPLTGRGGLMTSVRAETCDAALVAVREFCDRHARLLEASHPRLDGPRMAFMQVQAGERRTVTELLAPFFRADDRRLVVRDPYLRKRHQNDHLEALLRHLHGLHQGATPLEVVVHTREDDDYEVRQRQAWRHEAMAHRWQSGAVRVSFRYEAFHDRELRIERADGTTTVVLMGRGLDMLDRYQLTQEVYLASFEQLQPAGH